MALAEMSIFDIGVMVVAGGDNHMARAGTRSPLRYVSKSINHSAFRSNAF